MKWDQRVVVYLTNYNVSGLTVWIYDYYTVDVPFSMGLYDEIPKSTLNKIVFKLS